MSQNIARNIRTLNHPWRVLYKDREPVNDRILKHTSVIQNATKPSTRRHVFAKSLMHKLYLSFSIFGNESGAWDVPIIILHDLLCHKRMWKGLAKTIVSLHKRPVITFDLRNHGKSKHYSSHTYEDMAEDILEMYRHTAIEKAILVGHGMGGRLAMTLALTQPEKVACLLILDISPVSTTDHMVDFYPKVLKAMKEIKFDKLDYYGATKLVRRELGPLCEDRRELEMITSNISGGNIDKAKAKWVCNVDALLKNFDNIASYNTGDRKYNGPTLFLGGQFSEYIPADDLIGIRDVFPHAVVIFIPKTGHFLHLQDPIACLEYILDFLAFHNF